MYQSACFNQLTIRYHKATNYFVVADHPDTKTLTDKQVEELTVLAKGADHSKEVLMNGLKGLGDFMWCANLLYSESDGQTPLNGMQDVSWLIMEVASIIDELDHLESNTNYTLHQDELIKASRRAKDGEKLDQDH